MEQVTNPILARLEQLGREVDQRDVGVLAEVLETWVAVARDWALPLGLRASPDQVHAARPIAERFAAAIASTNLGEGGRVRLNEICAPLGIQWPVNDSLLEALVPRQERGWSAKVAEEADPGEFLKAEQAAQRAAIVSAIEPLIAQGPESLCRRLQQLRPEIAATSSRTADLTREVFRHLAESVDDVVPWLEAAIECDLAWFSVPLVERMLAEDSITDELLDRLLGTDARGAVLQAGLETRDGSGMAHVVDSIQPPDMAALRWAFIRVTPRALARVNAHPDRGVAAAGVSNWAAGLDHLSGNGRGSDRFAEHLELVPGWEETLLGLTFPAPIDDYHVQHALRAAASSAPDVFRTMFVREVMAQEYVLDDLSEWALGAQVLSREDRTSIWVEVRDAFCARPAFWVLAGTDREWVAARLADGTVGDPTSLLGPVRFGAPERLPIEDIARLFAGYVEPAAVLRAIPDPLSGDRVDEMREKLEICEQLSKSRVRAVREVGQVGVEVFSTLLAEAEKDARERLIKGDIW
jgi:hypothetical protein